MRVLILNGAGPDDDALTGLADAAEREALARGAEVLRRDLAWCSVAWCPGCLECWTRTPGECRIDDAGRALASEYASSDATVLVTRAPFGSYGYQVKKAVDRFLRTLLPFFRREGGELHDRQGAERRPSLGVLALFERPDPERERTLAALLARNAVNYASPRSALRTVPAASEPARTEAARLLFDELLADAAPDAPLPIADVETLLPNLSVAEGGRPPKRALVLLGSAKPRGTSTSEILGAALVRALEARGVVCRSDHVQRDGHTPAGLARLARAVRSADLLVLSAPLYVDSWPALVLNALEAVAADRANEERTDLALAAILNCGFPEACQAAVAASQAALFARDTGARWMGALQMGGGGALRGRPLEQAGGMAAHLAPALDTAAEALAAGRPIPDQARAAFARPLVPSALYLAPGDFNWLWTPAHRSALNRLWRRPVSRAT